MPPISSGFMKSKKKKKKWDNSSPSLSIYSVSDIVLDDLHIEIYLFLIKNVKVRFIIAVKKMTEILGKYSKSDS